MIISKLINLIKLYKLKKIWKKNNKFNEITIKNICDIEKIKAGKYSYGPIEVYDWGVENESLEIGSFVSIANDVKFILGGNHRYDCISTYPYKVKFMGEKVEAYSNGSIIVEDDVWIGMNSIIMSGVRIGKGSIVAAGSVVTKNVLPYSIVGGNPAQLIKYRFNEELRNELSKLDYNNITKELIIKKFNMFDEKLNKENLKILLEGIK